MFFIASIVGGVINALAGGGGLITFPLLMLVVGPVMADATSAIALFPAYPEGVWCTRNLLTGVLGSGWLWLLLIPSVLGGLIGALLLSHTGNRNFMELEPRLVLLATIIIVLRPILVRRKRVGERQTEHRADIMARCNGGHFRGGTLWRLFRRRYRHLDHRRFRTLISPGDIRHVVALKNFLNGWMRGVAVLVLFLGR